MRHWTALLVLLVALTGCSRVVAGAAQPDPRGPGVTVSSDGYGIMVGFADAPVQLDLYTEPQCDHCAQFQADYGEDIRAHILTGRLAVTYRLLTFFDDGAAGYSGMVANALFTAVAPATSASTFQSFVETLWANQGLAEQDYTADDVAALAGDAGVDAALVAEMSAGQESVDTAAMDDRNMTELIAANPDSPGTPTVYDRHGADVVDISDPDWLNGLLRAA